MLRMRVFCCFHSSFNIVTVLRASGKGKKWASLLWRGQRGRNRCFPENTLEDAGALVSTLLSTLTIFCRISEVVIAPIDTLVCMDMGATQNNTKGGENVWAGHELQCNMMFWFLSLNIYFFVWDIFCITFYSLFPYLLFVKVFIFIVCCFCRWNTGVTSSFDVIFCRCDYFILALRTFTYDYLVWVVDACMSVLFCCCC